MIELSRSLALGERIQQFEIRQVFPPGGFGVTYRAWDTRLGREVAIKEFLPEGLGRRVGADDSWRVEAVPGSEADFAYRLDQYLQEARVLAGFNHPNIIKVYDFFEFAGTAYIVMEYARGQSLKEILIDTGVLNQRQCLEVFVPILRGLEVVHQAGFLHRDIKPANIYVRDNGEPVLIDFGAARAHRTEAQQAMTAMVSLGYAPPEQYGSDGRWLGPWSDIYSIGASLYHCINGNAPEEATSRQTHLHEDGFDPLKPASHSGGDGYGRDFLELIDAMLALRVKLRPQSVAELLTRFDALAASENQAGLAQLLHQPADLGDSNDSASVTDAVSMDAPTELATRIATASAPSLSGASFTARLKQVPRRSFGLVAVALVAVSLGVAVALWPSDKRTARPPEMSSQVADAPVSPSREPADYRLVDEPEQLEPRQPQSRCQRRDPEATNYPLWQPERVYNSGDKVQFEQLVWRAGWWTKGEPPGRADVWTLASDIEQPWSQRKVYNAGDEVDHMGRRYRARWWTQGNTPGPSEVWQEIGPARCG